MTTIEQQMTEQTAPVVRKNANWLMLLGILLVVLGVIGLGMEVSLTIGSVLFFGFLILAGGILQLIDAVKAEGWKSVLYHARAMATRARLTFRILQNIRICS